MKKIIFLVVTFAVLFVLNGCGSSAKPTLEIGDTPDSQKAVIVGKVILSPKINDDGEPTKKTTDLLEFNSVFTKGDGSKRDQNKVWDDDYDFNYETVPTSSFFAIEVEPQNKVSWNGLAFFIERKSFLFEDNFYDSNLRGFMITIKDKILKNKAYYIGTIKIELSKKGFKETGDEEYDMNDLHYIVPKKFNVINEYNNAKSWFKKNYKKDLMKANVSTRKVKTESEYTNITRR
jgi:hypothetical protein